MFDYPPVDRNDPSWLEAMAEHVCRDGELKRSVDRVKGIVAQSLYHSTILELELTDLLNKYDEMLRNIGQRNGKQLEEFLRKQASLLVIPALNEEGVVHFRQPSPPQQLPRPNPRLFAAPAEAIG